MKKSQSMVSTSSSSKASSTGSVIPRDKSLQSFTQALIHADPNQENIYETVDNNKSGSVELVDLGKNKRSDSAYTFQSYEGSSRSSTLSSAVSSAFNKPLMGTRVLPPRNHRLVDVEYVESKFSSANNYYRYVSISEFFNLIKFLKWYFSSLEEIDEIFQLTRRVFSFHVEIFFLLGEPKTSLVIKR